MADLLQAVLRDAGYPLGVDDLVAAAARRILPIEQFKRVLATDLRFARLDAGLVALRTRSALDEETARLLRAEPLERNQVIIGRYFGWGDGEPTTLDAAREKAANDVPRVQ